MGKGGKRVGPAAYFRHHRTEGNAEGKLLRGKRKGKAEFLPIEGLRFGEIIPLASRSGKEKGDCRHAQEGKKGTSSAK